MSEKKTFSIRLQPEVMKKVRLLSVEKETSLSDLLEEAINDLIIKYDSGIKKEWKKH